METLHEKTATVIGTNAAGLAIPHLVRQLNPLHVQRADLAAHLEVLLEAHPLLPGPDFLARN